MIKAAANGNIETLELLLQKGADINAISDHGETALIVAAMSGQKEVINILLQNNVDINAKDDAGRTTVYHHLGVWSRRVSNQI